MLCSLLLCLHLASFAFICPLLCVFPCLYLSDYNILWSSVHFYRVLSSVVDSLLCFAPSLASFAVICRVLRVFPPPYSFYTLQSVVFCCGFAPLLCSFVLCLHLASFAFRCRLLRASPSTACAAASVSTTCCLLLWPGSFCSHLFRFFHCQFGFSSLLPLESIYPRACECEAALHRYGEVTWAKKAKKQQ